MQCTQQSALIWKSGGYSSIKSLMYFEELITNWIFGLGSPAELQQQRKLIVPSQFGYLCRNSSRFACLSSAWSYSCAIDNGTFFFCHPDNPADIILDTNGTPYFLVACTIFTFGLHSSISTPYFSAVSLTWSFMAFISSPVLKNAYLTGGRLKIFLVRSIRSIIISLSDPPEYEHIAFGCSLNRFAIMLCIALNFAGASKSA